MATIFVPKFVCLFAVTCKQSSSKHTPDPLIAPELHNKSVYGPPLTVPQYNIKPERRHHIPECRHHIYETVRNSFHLQHNSCTTNSLPIFMK